MIKLNSFEIRRWLVDTYNYDSEWSEASFFAWTNEYLQQRLKCLIPLVQQI